MEWISVKDRLPEKSGEYLVIDSQHGLCIADYDSDPKYKDFRNAFKGLDGYDIDDLIRDVIFWGIVELPEPLK